LILKRKFKHQWSTIPPISTKRKTSSHAILTKGRPQHMVLEICPGLGHAQKDYNIWCWKSVLAWDMHKKTTTYGFRNLSPDLGQAYRCGTVRLTGYLWSMYVVQALQYFFSYCVWIFICFFSYKSFTFLPFESKVIEIMIQKLRSNGLNICYTIG
jgi:hypothetical protein